MIGLNVVLQTLGAKQCDCPHTNIQRTYPRRKLLGIVSRRIDVCKDCGKKLKGKWWIGSRRKTVRATAQDKL